MSTLPVKKLSLESALEHSYSCLLHNLDESYVYPEQQIPRYYLDKSLAIIFLTELNHITSKASQGILLFHLSKNQWSAPCSIVLENTYGIDTTNKFSSFYLSETDYILLIQDINIIKYLTENNILKLSDNILMDGPLGRNTVLYNNLNHEDKPLKPIFVYSISRTSLLNTNIKNNPHDHHKWLLDYNIMIAKYDNEEYYKNRLSINNISLIYNLNNFYGNKISIPEHDIYYCNIVDLLNTFISSNDQNIILNKKKELEEPTIVNTQNIATSTVTTNTNTNANTNANTTTNNNNINTTTNNNNTNNTTAAGITADNNNNVTIMEKKIDYNQFEPIKRDDEYVTENHKDHNKKHKKKGVGFLGNLCSVHKIK